MGQVTVTGLEDAQALLGGLESASAEAATQTVNSIAKSLAAKAAERTSEVYNLEAQSLSSFIRVQEATGTRRTATVTLQVRPVPLSQFAPQVVMASFGVRAFGRYPTQRRLPTIELQLYRRGARRRIPGAFPLRQRSSGALQGGDRIRKRTSRSRNKLTGLRYLTFPDRHLKRLLPELEEVAGEMAEVRFRAAFRRTTKMGRRRLGESLRGGL